MKKNINEIEVKEETIITPKYKSPYKKPTYTKTSLLVNNSYIGETIEQKIRRITTTNEPIGDSAPIIYTERKDGVRPEYNIKTDRFELAIEGMDKFEKSITAERASRENPPKTEGTEIDKIEP